MMILAYECGATVPSSFESENTLLLSEKNW